MSAYKYKIYNVAILHDTRPTLAAAGALISQTSLLVLVEPSLRDLCSCATPVVPEMRGNVGENPPRSCRRRPFLDPRTPPSEIIDASPVAASRLA
jgi:hypothetical protein